ncbi:MAG TPA: protein-L-isoaspartate(D-aspartate) O-methyltransferase [Thermoanaerobaculia bacterium]|nr:protein-L-isoaspartate(D-aspartate) O-methyltransferase [Thermoanaerobaculia bacterium]
MPDFAVLRREMVELQIAGRGVRDPRVLEALRTVPREAFVPERLAEFAYEDTPLPIDAEQTISQPYIVALMAEALELSPGDCVLEVGAGSGYAAAVLGRIAGEVWAIERHQVLADQAARRIERLGASNVHVVQGDGTLGLPEQAPFDAIVVAAGGPEVPPALVDQLAPGGRLVMPIGPDPRLQELVLVRKDDRGGFSREHLGGVRFVPLVGAQGWTEEEAPRRPAALHQSSTERRAVSAVVGGEEPSGVVGTSIAVEEAPSASSTVLARPGRVSTPREVAGLLRETAEPFDDIEDAELGPLLERIGDSRLVLLGEATHGTSEFYRMRARITRELIRRKGFNVVAVEADWPDAATIDRYIRPRIKPIAAEGRPTFSRFPTWMWRNREVQDFVQWLRAHNETVGEPERKVSFHGLDLYSLYSSIHSVISYLDGIDPDAARVARLRYGCLTPWEQDPALYGEAALVGRYETCEPQVIAALVDLLQKQMDYEARDGDNYLEALQNARVAATAERYYRVMYYGSRESWNLRDRHMFDTLETVLRFRGLEAKAVVWEHNSHVGNAAATEMGARGELNVGQLAREQYGDGAFLVGFGTDHGTVAAATNWDEEMQIKTVRPSHAESYERVCHETGIPAFLLHLREPRRAEVRAELEPPRLERAIGVIYRPDTELMSHYFQAVLPWQFDEYIWLDETRAVTPLGGPEEVGTGMPETYPFGL